MNCDLCDDKASVFLTQIVDGQMEKVNLCEQCAKAKGVTDPTGFALADLLLGLGDSESSEPKEPAPESSPVPPIPASVSAAEEKRSCHNCGFTHAQFKKAGRLGCPKCYQIFGTGLETLLKAMHKGTQHIGKVPSRHQALLDHHYELDDLKGKLDDAIGREAFEEAAQLRDQIVKLETELASLAVPPPQPPTTTEEVGS